MPMKVHEEGDCFQKILPSQPSSPSSMDSRCASKIVPLKMDFPSTRSTAPSSAPSSDTSFSGPRHERIMRRIYLRRFLRANG
mmetsp:Transcript_13754/g.15991  ORF Transcript_13754/g.15991 Transcript_13754/m.15991 type:complete len:82 (-) Transcript_13754:9-254(-)